MNQSLGELLPLGTAVLISPLPIAAAIILLFTPRPKPNAAAYWIGFVLGVAAVLAGLSLLAGTQDLSGGSSETGWVTWLKIVLGLAIVGGGIRRLRNRPASGEAETPRWMHGIESFSAGRSFAVGLAIGALNPKNIVVGIAAAVIIAGSSLSTGTQMVVVDIYALFASLGVLAPLVVAAAMGQRSDEILQRWRTWLFDNNAAVVAVVFLVIGAVVAGKGIAAL